MSSLSPPTAPGYRHARIRAAAMALGGVLLAWRTAAIWALGVALLLVSFLLLAVVFPRVYVPIARGLDRLETMTVKAVSWTILALVFTVIFIPGRFFFSRRRMRWTFRRDSATTGTLWETCTRDADSTSFGRQF